MKQYTNKISFSWDVHENVHEMFIKVCFDVIATIVGGRPRGLTGSPLDHRSLPPEFESRPGHI